MVGTSEPGSPGSTPYGALHHLWYFTRHELMRARCRSGSRPPGSTSCSGKRRLVAGRPGRPEWVTALVRASVPGSRVCVKKNGAEHGILDLYAPTSCSKPAYHHGRHIGRRQPTGLHRGSRPGPQVVSSQRRPKPRGPQGRRHVQAPGPHSRHPIARTPIELCFAKSRPSFSTLSQQSLWPFLGTCSSASALTNAYFRHCGVPPPHGHEKRSCSDRQSPCTRGFGT